MPVTVNALRKRASGTSDVAASAWSRRGLEANVWRSWYDPRLAIPASHTARMTAVGQGTVRRTTQFPVPLLRTNVKPARSKSVRVPL